MDLKKKGFWRALKRIGIKNDWVKKFDFAENKRYNGQNI